MTQSLPPNAEQLTKVLQESEMASRRKVAAEALGELSESSIEVVSVLVAARDLDTNEDVRQAAAQALANPAHQAILEPQADTIAEMTGQVRARIERATRIEKAVQVEKAILTGQTVPLGDLVGWEASLASANETPLPAEAETLVRKLQGGGQATQRKEAAEAMGNLSESGIEVVVALMVAKDYDANEAVRQAAEKALTAPINQTLLEVNSETILQKVTQIKAQIDRATKQAAPEKKKRGFFR